ncbi:response regulator transcription factor [Amycolatopsis sp. Hca4]|uniref:response regulator n=1 Tax=unclassified Amycolatopsis TaxID=2618356 RepID=UPI0015914ECA|nr:response regulator transcription factor [Amycolatopsis sp. Hca4]QKV79736.1 response regulator transcription factor [Amycolatopsis sp. Hca4]
MVRVLVVDDQELIRAGLAALIRATPGFDVVGEAGSGEQAVAVTAERPVDVVLMDIRLPGISGIAATGRILARAGDRPKVLVLTTFDLDEYVYQALRAGASGFLLKDASPDQILAAIQAVAAGDMLFAPAVTRRLVEAFTPPAEHPVPALTSLTERETQVVRLVGHGMSNAEIADRLTVSAGTVKTHLNRAMGKLGVSSRAQAVVVAYESGLVVPGAGRRYAGG